MRLIDAESLESQAKECIENEWDQRVAPTSWAHAEESFLCRIEDTPTVDAVPVVRCKDCKHLWRDLAGPFCGCGRGLREIYHDTFCSYGERDGDAHA